MNRAIKNSRLICFGMTALAVGMLTACGEKAVATLATPTSTIQSYMSLANSLQATKTINVSLVKDALQCFSKADRVWFQENYKTFPLDELSGNAAMAVSEPVIRAAMVFTLGVVPSGPRGQSDKVEVVSQSDTDATVKVDDYYTIPLVKEGPNWRIKGIFGAKGE